MLYLHSTTPFKSSNPPSMTLISVDRNIPLVCVCAYFSCFLSIFWPYLKYEHIYSLAAISTGLFPPPTAWRATGMVDRSRSTKGKHRGTVASFSAAGTAGSRLEVLGKVVLSSFSSSGITNPDVFSTNATSSITRNFPGITLLWKGLVFGISRTNVPEVSNHSTAKPSTSS